MDRAWRLANLLADAGVAAESVVGLCLERGHDMVASMLAVWLAGGAYLPLDPSYPPARLTFMLADSRAAVLVTTSGIADELPAGRLRTLVLDDPAATTTTTATAATTTTTTAAAAAAKPAAGARPAV